MKAVLARKATYDRKHYVNNRTWKVAKVVKGACCRSGAVEREREREREREKKREKKIPLREVSVAKAAEKL